jgi:hypothetical protein
MCARNIGSPHIGHGRLPTGGICDRCIVRPLHTGGSANGSLCHLRLMRQRLPIDSLSLEQYAWRVASFSAVKRCNALSGVAHLRHFAAPHWSLAGGVA